MDERLHKSAVEILKRVAIHAQQIANDPEGQCQGMQLIPVNIPWWAMREVYQVLQSERAGFSGEKAVPCPSK